MLVTVTLTFPEPGGEVARISVPEITSKLIAGIAPNRTPVALSKPEPSISITEPPAAVPAWPDKLVTFGAER